MAVTNQQQAFLFMPDISGFSKFVNETEIEHSTHIIRELLEIIINATTTHYSEEFDDVLINYKYIPIDLWLQEIEPVGNGTHDLPTHFISALSVSKPIEAPATEVFTYITNLSNRAQWMEGTKRMEIQQCNRLL